MNPNNTLFQLYLPNALSGKAAAYHVTDERLLSEMAESLDALDAYVRRASVARALQRRLKKSPHITIHEAVWGAEPEQFDWAWLELPKGRDVARAMLYQALQSVKVGGMLYVAGPNKGGAKSAQKDLSEFLSVNVLGTKARHRLFAVKRPETVQFPEEWGTPWELQTRTIPIREHNYTVHTQPGVFSWDHLDEGTAFLLEQLPTLKISAHAKILDAGCGYGILGMVAQREFQAAQTVWADDDLLAVACTQAGLPDDATVLAGDVTQLDFEDSFDLILCNPPFHTEFEKDVRFMRTFSEHMSNHLSNKGQLVIVGNSFLPYTEDLKENFSKVFTLAENTKFRIWVASHENIKTQRRRAQERALEVDLDDFYGAIHTLHNAFMQGEISLQGMADKLQTSEGELVSLLESLHLPTTNKWE